MSLSHREVREVLKSKYGPFVMFAQANGDRSFEITELDEVTEHYYKYEAIYRVGSETRQRFTGIVFYEGGEWDINPETRD